MAKLQGLAALFVAIFLAFAATIQSASGEILCENLPNNKCSFAISSSGMRCALEKFVHDREVWQHCRTSEVKVYGMSGWIEIDRCISSCGVDRGWTGISSDSLLDITFVERLCAAPCYQNCPNIVNLYFNVGAAEGVFLPKLCEALKSDSRRTLTTVISSSFDWIDEKAPPSKYTPNPKMH